MPDISDPYWVFWVLKLVTLCRGMFLQFDVRSASPSEINWWEGLSRYCVRLVIARFLRLCDFC